MDSHFLEYHSFAGDPAELATLFDILATEGFTVHVGALENGVRPFVTRKIDRGSNFACNIWAWRDSSGPTAS